MTFDLVKDFTDVLAAIPQVHPRYRILKLLDEAMRQDVHFVDRHPTTLFQSLWNSFAAGPDDVSGGVDGIQGNESSGEPEPSVGDAESQMCEWLHRWRNRRDTEIPGRPWIASLRKPSDTRDTGEAAVLRGRWYTSVAFSPDGRWLAGGENENSEFIVKLWKRDGLQPVDTMVIPRAKKVTNSINAMIAHVVSPAISPRGPQVSLAFAPDSRHIAVAHEASMTVWDTATRTDMRRRLFDAPISAFTFSPDGNSVFVALDDGNIVAWRILSNDAPTLFADQVGRVTALGVGPDRNLLVGSSEDGRIRIWNIETKVCQHAFEAHADGVRAMAVSPTERLIASTPIPALVQGAAPEMIMRIAAAETPISLWDFTGKLVRALPGHRGGIPKLVFSQDGRCLVSAGSTGKAVSVWDVENGKELHKREFNKWVMDAAIAPDGETVAGVSVEQPLCLWSARRVQPTRSNSREHRLWIKCMQFSPDGNRLATGSIDRTARIWNVFKGEVECVLSGERWWEQGVAFSHLHSLAFSRDGRWLSVASGGPPDVGEPHNVIVVVSTDNWHPEKYLAGHTASVQGVCFSPDGQYAVSCSRDGTVRRWDLPSSSEVQRISFGNIEFWGLCCSADGQRLAVAAKSKHVCVLDFQSGQVLWQSQLGFPADQLAFSTSETNLIASPWWELEHTMCPQGTTILKWETTTNGNPTGMLTDVVAMAGNAEQYPWLVVTRPDETQIVSRATGEIVGWYPVSFALKATHPSGVVWSGAQMRHNVLHLIRLEGVSENAARQSAVSHLAPGQEDSPLPARSKDASAEYVQSPRIAFACLKETIALERHIARLFTDCQADGAVQYVAVLVVISNDTGEPVLYVTVEYSEASMTFREHGLSPYMLCAFTNHGRKTFGNEEDWSDIDRFRSEAVRIVCAELGETTS